MYPDADADGYSAGLIAPVNPSQVKDPRHLQDAGDLARSGVTGGCQEELEGDFGNLA
ncbi:hypothetical protein CKA32_004234 [Geitlerinema sp. FC II]|nr:hypothetical protein CKA32_004234 [Geitlerinema sp. FC II]